MFRLLLLAGVLDLTCSDFPPTQAPTVGSYHYPQTDDHVTDDADAVGDIFTPSPSPPPSGIRRETFELTLGLSGMSCHGYGSAEEAVVNSALSRVITGTSSAASFGAHSCSDSERRLYHRARRALQETSATITTSVAVDESQVVWLLSTLGTCW